MAYAILAVVVFVASICFFVGAAAAGSVFLRLLRRGPAAAQEAYEHGDSIGNWWKAQAPEGFTPHGLRARCSLAGRFDKDVGVYGVEERASQPTYMR